MFNKRWKKILLWSLSVIVVLGVAGLFAANYAVDKLMSSMAGGLELETTDPIVGEPVHEVVPEPKAVNDNIEPIETTEPKETTKTTEPVVEPTIEPTPQIEASNQPKTNQDVAANVEVQATPVAIPSTSQPSGTPTEDKSSTSTEGYTAQVSPDKAQQIQENVTVKEKADVASIVLGQLSVSDIKRLQELASGGLTIDEKREARSIVLGKVSEEEYNELSQIAKKYGVSRGLTHDQVLIEEQANEEGSE